TCAFANPQGFGGSDVMHRISYDEANPGELQKAVVSAINREIRDAAKRHRFPRRAIYEIVVAGNTTMRDLLFGIDVYSVGQKPYRSLVEAGWREGKRDGTALEANAWDLGFRANRKTRLYGLPLIASHVGGDTAACLAATGLDPDGDAPEMLIDIGTNTEVVVRAHGRMLAASCPAGPAFEGGLVTWAMRAFDGAIESLDWQDGDFTFRTISDAPPEGLCGSGLVDLVATLRRQELMNPLGIFSGGRKQMQIGVVPERGITFSRADGSHLAQAKAANACGQQIVLRSLGIAPEKLDRVTLAGGFANTLDVDNAIAIGLLAPVNPAHVVKVGNAALHGARKVLLSLTARRALEDTVTRVEHIELETQPDFFDLFVEGCQFKPMMERPEPPLQRSAG
ncbi:MAG: ASKHA domain-containing protein, partial [Alphaproteobacteria bacterium]|nr:ASKHA domain-containing protein [Alphaproteobacteria bacterium]